MATTINDILISELDRASVPAVQEDELVLNQTDAASGEFVTRRISWAEVGQSIRDLSGDIENGITDQVLFGDGTEPGPSITFKNDQTTGIYRPLLAVPSMAITADGQEVMRFSHDPTQARVGIGFHNNDPDVPEDGLHIKLGGIILDWGLGLRYNVTNKYGPSWEDSSKYDSSVRLNVETRNSLTFATNDIERGRFTRDGDFTFYRALGVGGWYGDDNIQPDYGKAGTDKSTGSILISGGPAESVIWKDAVDFFDENVSIITDILVNNPEFIQEITENLDYEIIGNNLINNPNFIDAIVNDLDIEIDMGVINENLGDLNIGDGLTFENRVTGPGITRDFLIVDNTIARGVFDDVARKNIEVASDKLVANTELIFGGIDALP